MLYWHKHSHRFLMPGKHLAPNLREGESRKAEMAYAFIIAFYKRFVQLMLS